MPNRTVSVLLVEDDDIDAEIVIRSFARLKIINPITIARDGLEALSILRGEDGYARLPRPYLILLDIKLPRMNGLELLRALRQDDDLLQSIVFVLTTSNNEADMKAAYESHVAGYFLKAHSGDEFLNLPKLMKSYWRMAEFPPAR